MKLNRKTIAVAMAVIMALSLTGGALAAPGTFDGSGDGADYADAWISDGTTLDAEFNASGDTTYGLAIDQSGETSPTAAEDMAMNVTKDGEEYHQFSGTWDTYDADSSGSADSLKMNFTDDELGELPVDPNDNVSVNVTYWDANATDPAPDTATVYLETTGERNVKPVTSDGAAVTLEELDSPLYRPFADAYNATTVEETAAMDGSNTTITYHLNDAEVQETFEDSTSSISQAGSFTLMKAEADGEAIPVYYSEVPSEFETGDAHAVYDPGTNTLTVHPSDDFDGQEMDVMASSDVYRVTDIGTVWGLNGFDGITQMVMG